MAMHRLSKTRACAAVKLSRASWYRPAPSAERQDREIMDALNALIEKHPCWGFWMCYDRLRLTGRRWDHKRVYRVYTAMKLNLPRRKKRRVPARDPQPMARASCMKTVSSKFLRTGSASSACVVLSCRLRTFRSPERSNIVQKQSWILLGRRDRSLSALLN